MSSKKKANTNQPSLRIGSRVRCTDDGVAGRITWANAVSVKIKWDDGEEVTWRRDALATEPIEFLDADADSGDDHQAEPPATAAEQTATGIEVPQTETEPRPATPEPNSVTEVTVAKPAPLAQEQATTTTERPAAEAPAQEPPQALPDGESEPTPDKPKRPRKAPAEPKEKKVSALDAAARVLAEENRPMTCQDLIDVMAARGYWASPKGATSAATLYSAILRELTTKGSAARFIKTERGKFARHPDA
jgi:hypothetical protein